VHLSTFAIADPAVYDIAERSPWGASPRREAMVPRVQLASVNSGTMTDDGRPAVSSHLLRFHDHRGEGWTVHTEEISLAVEARKAVFSGNVFDPSSMAYGDGQTNEYDWATVELSADELIDGLARVQLGETWEHKELRFTPDRLSVGTSSLASPGPATAHLSDARRALLFLDANDAVFATLEQARSGTRLPARQVDKIFLDSVRQHPEHLMRLGQVGLERTLHALLQEAHLDEVSMRAVDGASGLYLVEARGEERGTLLLSVQRDATEKLGLHIVDRINGVRDRKMLGKAVVVTRSSFTDDVFHSYAGFQDRMQLVDFDRLKGMVEDAGWTKHETGFLTLPVAERPRSIVFISYSHTNRDFARWLYNRIHGWGLFCVFDDVDLRAGEVILSALQRAIGGADAVLLCCSQKALESPWVRAEIEYATQREKDEGKTIIVPLDLDGALSKVDALPGVPDYMLVLRERLAVDFRGWKPNEPSAAELSKIRKALEGLNQRAQQCT
jgi:hypothetical protein